ncbi:hypothetical protein BDV06DRAFT_215274 [Aspergillus oleicola]
MSKPIVNTTHYPFSFNFASANANESLSLPDTTNVCGRIPSIQASRLRSMILEAHDDPSKILAQVCSYDALTSKLCEEAGFPAVFLAGYAIASSLALPDTGYIAFQEVAAKIQEVVRAVNVPVIADGTRGFAHAGAAGIMIEDQTWPKRCGHTKGKSVVSRSEAYARWQAAVDARNNGVDIWILARTDSFIHGYDEALTRAKEAIRIGVDAVFVEALPDKATMARLRNDLDFPVIANIIEGGKTENVSACDLAGIGYSAVLYPWILVAAKIKSVREALEGVKRNFAIDAPPVILGYQEVCEAVGFDRYYELEERYQYEGSTMGSRGYQWEK